MEAWISNYSNMPYPNFKFDGPSGRVIVHPPTKLAFCYIEKNACTTFNRLFNRLNQRNIYDFYFQWFWSHANAFGLRTEDLTRERGWKWAVFLHDPLERYLSAWHSKCAYPAPDTLPEDHGLNCVPKGMLSNASVEAFEAHVLATARTPPESLASNPHWAPQQLFCGGLRDAAGYDFVGHLEGDVNAQVHDMLRMVGASEEYVDELFPESGNHYGHEFINQSLDSALYYRNPSIADAVKKMYLQDYRLPGMSESRVAS